MDAATDSLDVAPPRVHTWSDLARSVRGPAHLRALTVAHVLTTIAGSFITVALASSIFFRLSPEASRVEVLKYLAVTVAPLALLAPALGPLVDRFPNRQRWIGAISNLVRAVCCVGLALTLNTVGFYGWALVLLIGNKAFSAAKYSLIPRIVTDPKVLIETNSRLSRWSAATGTVGVVSAAFISHFVGPSVLLWCALVLFVLAAIQMVRVPSDGEIATYVSAARLRAPRSVRTRRRSDVRTERSLRRPARRAVVASIPFIATRSAVGFFTFTLAFSLRRAGEPAVILGALAVMYSLGSLLGNVAAPAMRRIMSEEKMIVGPSALALFSCQLAVISPALITTTFVAFSIGLASSHIRQAFDGVVQSTCTDANRGRSFAKFETRSQIGWAAGSALATGLFLPFQTAAAVLALMFAAALIWFGRANRRRNLHEAEQPTTAAPTDSPTGSPAADATVALPY